jgi:hypothetical protein
MAAILFLVAFVAVCILAAAYGKDSRFDERDYHRPNL